MSHVCLALKILEALAELHASGVVHNNITAVNIIIKENKTNSSFKVKIIGLRLASVFLLGDCVSEKLQKDISCLGAVFFELFTGVNLCCSEDSNYDWNIGASNVTKQEISATTMKGSINIDHFHNDQCGLLRSRVPWCLSTMI
eukprot:10034070-Ditylum_brightwellii.AAC.1